MRQVPAFFLVIIIDAMSFGIVTPVLAPLVNQTSLLGGSDLYRHVMYGLLQSIAPLCYMIGAPLLGYFSDRLGRKKILFYCTFGSLFGLMGYTIAFITNSLLILFVARIIVGATTGSLAIAQAAIADISSGAEKAKNIGIIAVAMTIGLVAGPLLGGVFSDPTLVSWFNNTTPFYVGIFLVLINIVVLLKMLKNDSVNASREFTFFHDLCHLFKLPKLRSILIVFFVFELGWSLYYSSIALLLSQQFHFSNKMIGIFSSYIGFILSIFLFLGVRIVVRKIPLRLIIMPSLLVAAIVLGIGFLFNSMLLQWGIVVLIALPVALCYSILITLASDQLPSYEQGLLMGVTDSLLSLAFAITGLLSGILAVNNAVLPELVAGLFFMMATLIFYMINRGKQ
jgi:DHA1 family tetracycline resistance protein-like MFS transporter